ncbi:potassium channel family protein [Parasporobacterium paucivorans]|uniref:Trk system potassium uptake protein TrkA n=1 Tax=Parasporobacterium paucivorans DSM 15970 TaxID=1122934 RepID=A0A1M6IV59_9FIRM|nr:TrkA family potassium uptake protein [Parasporobacterium paucivorans]SHJ38322.1 trk system potassium uptake protein TrkA [Parasporobacterium paucivorans DSM 15970]
MKSILIIGLGRFGRHMGRKLIEEGNEVLAIEKSEERADTAVSVIQHILIGDATNSDFMRTLGVSNFDLCVVAIGDNFAMTLEIVVLLKDIGAKHILARANRDRYKKLLLRNGADEVVYAEREIAERLAVKYSVNNVFDYVELTPEYGIYEVAVPEAWVGKSISEQSIRTKHHVNIMAIKRGEVISPLPHPDHVFAIDERLIIMGHYRDIKRLVTK